MFRYLIVQTILLAMAFGTRQANGCLLSATVLPTKPSFIYGEPIELRVSLANRNSKEIAVAVNYPSFQTHGLRGIRFTAEGGLTPRGGEDINHEQLVGGRALIQKIAAGDEWSVKLYLQTYFQSPAPGDYKLNYNLELPCLEADGTLKDTIKLEGTVSFTVGPANEGALQEVVKTYDRQLESTSFWELRTAAEALAAMDDPVVIPELTKLIKLGDSDLAFKTLARFKGNTEAETLVRSAINSKKASTQLLAIDVWLKWKTAMPKAEFEMLLKAPERQVRLAALRYARTVHAPGYLSLVKGVIDDQDPDVAKEARLTKQVLERDMN
ncbi:MAG: HEAT repeat domain-containing protein [Pyrinomonadaceae bacterium]